MSTIDDSTDTDTGLGRGRHRTDGYDAPRLVAEGHVANGDRLMSITAYDGMTYWFAERSRTTLELRSIDDSSGEEVESEIVAGTHYEDLPAEVRKTLKLEGYRMKAKNSLIAKVMQ